MAKKYYYGRRKRPADFQKQKGKIDDRLTIEIYIQEKDEPYKNQFLLIGDKDVKTGTYMGDEAIASEIIAKVTGARMSKDGYTLASKNIEIIWFPSGV